MWLKYFQYFFVDSFQYSPRLGRASVVNRNSVIEVNNERFSVFVMVSHITTEAFIFFKIEQDIPIDKLPFYIPLRS
ncbi:hypothetical protein DPK65_20710 [Salmonella enterica subsp. enterica]|nr:hypothetical protein [Salmonella enterica subsp. enterica]ECJ4521145.1 hypothetical protein [Salmonella enterica subsp. enterica]